MTTYLAPLVLLPDGWRKNVRIGVTTDGRFAEIGAGAPSPNDIVLAGPVVPGMPNLHSHAFQRAMAGLAEMALNPQDSFWTWRDLMYRLVSRLRPEHVQAIASRLYIEMLKAGYTSVAEFHYVHHGPNGQPYADIAEMSVRILAAGKLAGIGITLLPTFYAHGGFGGQAPSEKQSRFLNDTGSYLRLLETVSRICKDGLAQWGLCFHSLRAVTKGQMAEILGSGLGDGRPVHIHIAEQTKEVADCLAWSGRRPIQWLYENAEVDGRWCLIHATHADHDEVAAIAKSGAVVGLCPTTEANLGDGLFPAVDFADKQGRFGIGSDSHVSVSVVEELRWLEYGQRLRDRHRNRLAPADQRDVGSYLYKASLAGGAGALGRNVGAIRPGNSADFVVLDGNHPMLAHVGADQVLGRWLFGGGDGWVQDVMVAGKWVVRDGRHEAEEAADNAFKKAMGELIANT